MAETTLDAYMQKIIDIETASTNPNTTLVQLQTLINELATLDTQLDTEIDNMVDTPVDFRYMRKIILVEIERARKSNLQSALERLKNVRKANIKTLIESDPDGNNLAIQYEKETEDIKEFSKTVIDSCGCMSNRKYLIEEIVNGNGNAGRGNGQGNPN